jgi:hypothetical protein
MLPTILLLFALLLPGAAQASGCTPDIGVTEQFPVPSSASPATGPQFGRYLMRTGDLCGYQVVALAVDNNDSLSASSSLPGWNSLVVNAAFWDQGMVLSRDDFGTGSSYRFVTGAGPDGIGSFAGFFGPGAALANVYWLSAHFGGPVVDHSTAFTAVGTPIPLPDDAFEFEARAPASLPWAFLFNPQTRESSVILVAAVVPEPATWLLWLLGALGLFSLARPGAKRHALAPSTGPGRPA